jgi:hypothetical protein
MIPFFRALHFDWGEHASPQHGPYFRDGHGINIILALKNIYFKYLFLENQWIWLIPAPHIWFWSNTVLCELYWGNCMCFLRSMRLGGKGIRSFSIKFGREPAEKGRVWGGGVVLLPTVAGHLFSPLFPVHIFNDDILPWSPCSLMLSCSRCPASELRYFIQSL